MFTHEKLDVYKLACEFYELSTAIIESIPRGHGELRDQFKRAALSIQLNIAEGAGRSSRGDKSRFYIIARGSALECAAILDACGTIKGADCRALGDGKSKLRRVVSMLTRLGFRGGQGSI